MPFTSESERKISFKKILGKAATSNTKQPANEALFSFVQGAAPSLFGETPNPDPSVSALHVITDGNVEFVRLKLDPDPSADGHAFIASLPPSYESNSSNSNAGSGVFVNDQVVALTAGALQIVPPLYGLKYEAKPYRGGDATQGSGSLVPPGDAVDWSIDTANGMIFQENDPNTNPVDMDYLECFIYIGDMIADKLGGTTSSGSELIEGGTASVGVGIEVVASVAQSEARQIKWLVEAHDAADSKSYAAEVLATSQSTNVAHQVYSVITLGNPADSFCRLDVDLNAGDVRLLATVDENNVTANITQILVK